MSELNTVIQYIAYKLKAKFLDVGFSSNEISLFLCGGSDYGGERLRRAVGNRISQMPSKYKYFVHYPEDMFFELVLGHQKKDLLSLETLLADSVHSVVILLHSPGTCTELGAFANHPGLKDKLVVVTDPKYKKSGSFITRGPIRYLKTQTDSKILYLTTDPGNVDVLAKYIAESVRDIAKKSPPVGDLANPILSYRFYLSLIYVFDPVPRSFFSSLLKDITDTQLEKALVTSDTVINGLINERKVILAANKLSITPKGIDSLIYDSTTKKRSKATLSFLSDLRLKALNFVLRKRYYKVWAEQSKLSRAY